ncbi:hypothetical protein [Mucilaginibacter phyllosphaerae]|uniref:Membrane protein n=1 Tax=Mucilaginibacter phyllosphaerae TaxID=1812349 RepID=A0A4Y8ABB9_9SPHI|nr:hypothetical protein [Mucilaginibacter phyllosphaerae]MBB3969390.1 putative membrane protein [Mucilaginibacter phyllosphaerae]TEW65823.1 hypothetical protein E2R65_11840 [Mucilaginibacter phyllosphaerae]GGH08150.1 hypothetical protein GCM10007352_13200 [Mucilaginibacter phyllosphaerae]
MNDKQNSYESIKSDVKGAATGLFFVGGLIFLVIVLLSIIVAVKNSGFDLGLKTILIIGLTILLGLIVFSSKARQWILGGWLIFLVACIVLPMFALAFYFFYTAFTSK